MTIALAALLWAHPGRENDLIAYETAVLALLPDHGGRVVQRARTGGSDDQPLEIQIFEFESQAGVDSYLADPRRLALAGERDAAVARTELLPVTLE
ncbi:MAG: hypothetical protein ABJA94_06100 [Rhodoglobus sp.]